MFVEKHAVTVTASSSGAGTGYSPHITGRVIGIRYVRPVTTPLSTAADLTVTLEDTGTGVLTKANIAASATWYPRALVNKSTDGSADTNREPIYVAKERVKFAIASGSTTGADTVGTFHVWIG